MQPGAEFAPVLLHPQAGQVPAQAAFAAVRVLQGLNVHHPREYALVEGQPVARQFVHQAAQALQQVGMVAFPGQRSGIRHSHRAQLPHGLRLAGQNIGKQLPGCAGMLALTGHDAVPKGGQAVLQRQRHPPAIVLLRLLHPENARAAVAGVKLHKLPRFRRALALRQHHFRRGQGRQVLVQGQGDRVQPGQLLHAAVQQPGKSHSHRPLAFSVTDTAWLAAMVTVVLFPGWRTRSSAESAVRFASTDAPSTSARRIQFSS